MLTPNPGLAVWTIVTFILLALVLRRFAWKPLLDALHRREEHIHNSVDRAEQAKQEAERMLRENKQQLALAEQEAHRILSEGRALGEKLKQEIMEKAQQHSRTMIDQAKMEIERDKEAALMQLRGEVANLAIKAVEKILDETLDENKHRKIVDTYLRELPKN